MSSSLTWRTIFQLDLERRKQMPYKKLTIGGAKQEILSWANHEFSIEEQSMLRNVSRLPCLFKHVALMPDAHLGKGSMVGSVIASKDAVIPATVGVDIGCGMMAVKTPFKSGTLDGKLKELRLAIEEAIPVGFNAYKESVDESSYWDGWESFSSLHEGVHDRKAKAMKNREIMMTRLLTIFNKMFNHRRPFKPELTVNCHHNYVALEEHYDEEVFVTRKGAINAAVGVYGIIPGSMGAKSFIVKGRGLPESFNSCAHGAGRKMSRAAAKRAFTKDDLARQTSGVECRKDVGVLDEIPGAYKDIKEVMRNQSDLVKIVAEIKQVVCVKG